MTATLRAVRRLHVPSDLAATAPPEADRRARDDVRMLVAERRGGTVTDSHVRDLPTWLRSGDALVVNVSQTVPAALPVRSPDGRQRLLHVATPEPDTGRWIVEPRRPDGAGTAPDPVERPAGWWALRGGGRALLERRWPDDDGPPRLWRARLDLPEPLSAYLERHGEPVRYGYVREPWPIGAYRTTYGTVSGSAEMPSAGRPLTRGALRELRLRGIAVVPIVLHTGLSSTPIPTPERFAVPSTSADALNAVRATGGRIIAVGTSSLRALESVVDPHGVLHGGQGTTGLVIAGGDRVRGVDGILSGWHDADASHLDLLAALAGVDLLDVSYRAAIEGGYRWHEFGDLHLLLP